jgi:hypothetical protein
MNKLTLKERRIILKEKADNKINYFLTNLKEVSGAILTKEDEDTFFIISPSTYYAGQYQLTTFNKNDTYTNKMEATSHTQETTISDLIINNIGSLLNYTIAETV